MDGLDSGFGGMGGGGFGGGGGGMGDMMNNNPQMMAMAQAMQSDPEIMAAMSNPDIMAKLQQIQSNPAAAMQLMSDPQLAPILMKLQRLMGGGGGMGGMGDSAFGSSSTSSSTSSSSSGGTIIQITNGGKQLNELIEQSKKSKKLLAIDYYTTWCGPCKMISPTFNELSSTYHEKCIFAKVDGDQQLDLVKEQAIRGYPTFHFYYAGVKVDEFSGANVEQLRAIVSQYADKEQQSFECPYKHFPLRDNEIVTYTTVKWELIQQKIHELNRTIHDALHRLNPTDEGQVDLIITKLQDRSKYHVSEFTANQYHVMDDKLLQWPNELMSMPLHLLRMFVLHPHAAAHYTKQLDHTSGGSKKDDDVMVDGTNETSSSSSSSSSSKTSDVVTRICSVMETSEKSTIAQIAIWTLSNMFSRRSLQLRVSDRHEVILDSLSHVIQQYGHTDEKLITTCIALYINFAILFVEDAVHYETGKVHLLSSVVELMDAVKDNCKWMYRLLVVVGTLCYGDDNCVDLARDLEIQRIAEGAAVHHKNDENMQAVTKELIACIATKKEQTT